jgi:hypothetical protein
MKINSTTDGRSPKSLYTYKSGSTTNALQLLHELQMKTHNMAMHIMDFESLAFPLKN